jgi:hypothetical protein
MRAGRITVVEQAANVDTTRPFGDWLAELWQPVVCRLVQAASRGSGP